MPYQSSIGSESGGTGCCGPIPESTSVRGNCRPTLSTEAVSAPAIAWPKTPGPIQNRQTGLAS